MDRLAGGLDASAEADDGPGGRLKGNIVEERRHEVGRALAAGDESGWGETVDALLAAGDAALPAGAAPDGVVGEVVDGIVAVLARWDWAARPASVVPIPSRTSPRLVAELASRIGELGRLPVVPAVVRVQDTPPQTAMANSAHKASNALHAYRVDAAAAGRLARGPVLLLDLVSDSGWTLTTVTWQLRAHHPDPVLPLVLATRS